MSDKELKPIEDVKPMSDEDKAKAFVKEYELLCEKYQLRVVTQPIWKARDDNSWSLILTSSVGKLPQQS